MEDIAVVGIANLFPGSDTPETFWQQLLKKQDNRSQITKRELGVEPQKYYGRKGDMDKFYCMYGGYIRDFEFDSGPFISKGLNETYLNQLDSLHQWGLYVTYQALIDAGYWGSEKLQDCGLILGNLSFPTKTSNHLFLPLYGHVVEVALKQLTSSSFQLSNFSAGQTVNPDNALIAGFPSALLSQAAGLGGSVLSLDAACASSCYSVKLACDYLHTGKADMMLAGAVSGADPLFVNMGFSIFQAFPEDNNHAPLDKNSQGLFAAEGAGMMVLKRHADALRDGDKIHAIIKGGALSNDGKGEFVLSPNSKGQILAYQRAYQNAKVNPADVDYIECHATGTPKGDKVELSSMETFFSQYHNKPLLGSAKSNLGHLLTAAGMPGMTKAIWALNEGKIPATISLKNPMSSKNGYFGAAQMPVDMVNWPDTKDKTRSAGVSVFGFGGSNAHLVFQPGNTAYAPSSAAVKPREPLAIVGMDCHFGSATCLAEFDTLLTTGQTTFRELPPKRWKGMEQHPSIKQTLLLNKAPKGGYIENFDIDFLRFKVPPNKQDCLIPQQLLMMKVADNAAKDAQLTPGSNVAVLVAMGVELDLHQYRGRVNLSTQIEQSLKEQGIELSVDQRLTLTGIAKEGIASAAQLNQYTSFIGNIMASRIAALWDFSGPAFTVSSEENSVYRCLELAENLFQTSEVEAVLIASVDLAGSLENISLRQRYGPVSENATNRPNLLSSQQWLVGEGAGAFVVKPNSKANSNSVYATVDGLSFAAGSDAQAIEKAALKVCQIANLSCAQINHVEAFASGFSLDNQAEKSAFNKLYPSIKIDSVKRQVGHLFNASGMASIIKTALLLDKQKAGVNTAINGLGKDFCCAHLILSATDSARQSAPKNSLGRVKTPSLVKTITLGGDDIQQAILKQGDNPVFSDIKKQLAGKSLPPVSDPVRLEALQINRTRTAQSSSLDSALENLAVADKPATIQTATSISRAGVNVASKTSKDIFQQTKTHLAFIRSRHAAEQQIGQLIKLQVQLTSANPVFTEPDQTAEKTPSASFDSMKETAAPRIKAVESPSTSSAGLQIKGAAGYAYPPLLLIERYNQPQKIIYDSAALVEFAEGNIANVFGSDYAVIDSYARRVRLPMTDYLLVTRVTDLKAGINEYKKSYMATEYDIPTDAPFLIDGQIPWSVSVESGQCDLMLISYIGIDFQNKGERVYRLLDCELTFLEEMAFGGETLRYEIYIDSYAKNGEQLLFFFHYDCFVGDKKVLIMCNGCAGFFTDEELADGKGVIHNDQDKAQFTKAEKSYFQPLIVNQRSRYGYEEMLKLVDGDISGCFGPEYDQHGRNPSLKFSSKKFLMIERITKIDPQGGHWGLGLLEGQKDLEPDHWYFPCHFKGDQVMAGSLMSEGCGQMAMFLMLWLGMNSNVNNARFQPMPGEAQTVRCRGQVLPQSNTLTYRMEVTAMGMFPRPFIKANIDIILDGKVVVDFKNLSVEIKEQDNNSPCPVTLPKNVIQIPGAPLSPSAIRATRDSVSISVDLALSRLEKHLAEIDAAAVQKISSELADERGINPFKHPERPLMRVESDFTAYREKGVIPIKHFAAPMVHGQNRVPDQIPFTPWHLFEFATGDISKCFGPDFDVYRGRIPPRTPCGDLQVVTQVVEVKGKRLDLKNPASCIAQYYVPADAWYFTKNSHPNWMPYALLMEIALQPNGFLSGYMGTTLKYPGKELFFRNLDGNGTLLKQIDLRGKTIVNKSVLLSTSTAGGAIIQSFTFELLVDDQVFYTGNAVFGYFSGESLTNQLGIDNGKITQAWFVDHKTAPERIERFDLTDKKSPLFSAPAGKPYYRLAGGDMNFVDSVSIVEGGGKADLAYIYGERTIDESDWFFRYHFHQDPVMPGSLGVEAIIELLQAYALKNDLGAGFNNPRFITPSTQVIWKYRGQITPLNKQMSLDVHLTKVIRNEHEVRLVGDANLSKDGLRIYEVKNIVLSIVEA
ncbi:polyunsaturated fatty acid synthase PfaC [Psychromonas ingrahamii 37]|uniref:Polyunsaturated fatty acid synthase PfaC n=1 Tax=Psychromonas ingrahamii (strain DSM 17664 / CCUG 51855 / 37) TaxID=357804 RepID=A1SVG3_PSYIN|nr:beta-ketoacyl synthase N-terminal-like domain-containing protein [Psychromonas ingrahamii]ABM03478.1 polyunsaturated fatty acid synthase PfaC [Psychromonas ingrahamii 37]